MKISHHWLQSLCPHPDSADSIARRLTLAGLEVEEVTAVAPPLDGVVVARILRAEQHPNADRLRVCTVEAGSDEPLQIVCGAANARAGLVTALATVGSVLPGDFKIKKSKIRGELSLGMLCAGNEIGLEETPGILELDPSLVPGTPLSQALQLNDQVLDIALTPNRGDCLSALGVARELAALGVGTLEAPPATAVPVSSTQSRSIHIDDSADCAWYCGRVIEGLDGTQATPLWMRERLRRSGLRSRGPLVDVTNYVMIELGQPLHAFDLEQIHGHIQVRRARDGESLTLLNDDSVSLSPLDLIIADQDAPLALAGAMGGKDSAVAASTNTIFLESACFSPAALAGLGRRHKLHSDSLHRFERGTDPALPQRALERATALLLEICGGQAGPLTAAGAAAEANAAITLDLPRTNAILGATLTLADAERVLTALGCECREHSAAELHVVPPSWRRDLRIGEDLMEELARIVGYDALGGTPVRIPARFVAADATSAPRHGARDFLRSRGWSEVVSFSFVSAELHSAFRGADCPVPLRLANPISEQYAQMRSSLWASMLPIYVHNLRQSQRDLQLFEIGRVFDLDGAQIIETEQLAGLCGGARHPENWNQPRADIDFFDARGIVEDLLQLSAAHPEIAFQSAEHPALQPGQTARVLRDQQPIGWVGRLHPQLWRQHGEGQKAPFAFSLDAAAALRPQQQPIRPLPPYPASRRDLSFLVPSDVCAEDIMQFLKSNSSVPLARTLIFDRFASESLEEGFKSLAFGLIFQDFSRTLQDGVIDEAVASLVEGLRVTYQVRLRD